MLEPETMTIAQAGLRTRSTYNQVLRRVLLGELRGEQDERGRWRVRREDVERDAQDQAAITAVK